MTAPTLDRERLAKLLGMLRAIMEVAEPVWNESRIVSGLSSGEGLIWAVRDPIMGYEKQLAKASTPSGSWSRQTPASETNG